MPAGPAALPEASRPALCPRAVGTESAAVTVQRRPGAACLAAMGNRAQPVALRTRLHMLVRVAATRAAEGGEQRLAACLRGREGKMRAPRPAKRPAPTARHPARRLPRRGHEPRRKRPRRAGRAVLRHACTVLTLCMHAPVPPFRRRAAGAPRSGALHCVLTSCSSPPPCSRRSRHGAPREAPPSEVPGKTHEVRPWTLVARWS